MIETNPLANTTIREVAMAAGVSIRTVSRVLNNAPKVSAKTRKRVQDSMADLDFQPNLGARALASGRSFLLGVVQDDPNAATLGVFQRGIVDICSKRGYELLVHPAQSRDPDLGRNIADFVRRTRVDGLVLLPPISEIAEIPTMLGNMGVPVIGIAAVRVQNYRAMLISDEREAAQRVAEHLIALGHEKIAMITGPRHRHSSHERECGFREALAARGLPLPAAYIQEGDYGFDSGLAAARRLLDLPDRPTAIFAASDNMAAGVLKAAAKRGIDIPGKLSVAGFDDSELAVMLTPTLTTVHRPSTTMAREATERLLSMIENDQASRLPDYTVVLGLVERESTGPLRS